MNSRVMERVMAPSKTVSRRLSRRMPVTGQIRLRRQSLRLLAHAGAAMRRILVTTLSVALLAAIVSTAFAHDSWISRDRIKNNAGEWCCGEGDCFVVPTESVKTNGVGYELFGVETVPYAETLPSQPDPDGVRRFVRCKRPDGSRRCFFAPTPES